VEPGYYPVSENPWKINGLFSREKWNFRG